MITGILSSRSSIIMAVIAFTVAAIAGFGLVMGEDTVGRVVFTVVWVSVGLAWLGNLVRVKRSASDE
jgi:hypothetical protein